MCPQNQIADKKNALKLPGKILMVEDNTDLRESIAAYLDCAGFEITAVATGLDFFHALAERPYNVAVIDLGLPDISGLQLVEYVRNNTDMRCMILTARDQVDDRIAGYDSGADLYMVKPVDCRELTSALSRMLQRSPASGPALAEEQLQWRLNSHNATLVTPAFAIISLTGREMDFLLCLAESAKESVKRDVILAALGYNNDEFAHRALESLIRRLRRKIENVFGSSPILTRHGVGYSFSASIIVQ